MFVKPTEYNGEQIIKVSALVAIVMDVLKTIKDVSADPFLIADLEKILADLEDLFKSLQLMEIPNVYRGVNRPPDEEREK